jgi:hypothetical protein
LGRVRRAISIVKKRTSAHEDTIREFCIGTQGFVLGEPLVNFRACCVACRSWSKRALIYCGLTRGEAHNRF